MRKSDNEDVAADKQESVQRRLDWLSKQAGLFSFFSSGKDFTKDASEHRSKNAGLKKKKKGGRGRGTV